MKFWDKFSEAQHKFKQRHPWLFPFSIGVTVGLALWFLPPKPYVHEKSRLESPKKIVDDQKKLVPSRKLVVANKGLIPATTEYTVATDNSVVLVSKKDKKYVDIAATEGNKAKNIKIKNLPLTTPIEIDVFGWDSVEVNDVNGNTVVFMPALDPSVMLGGREEIKMKKKE